MQRYLKRLIGVTALICLSLLISGCPKTTNEAPAGTIVFVDQGLVLHLTDIQVIEIPDRDTRMGEVWARGMTITNVFIVPKDILEWLFKQAARARELESQ